ncbi:MAG TPA: GDSL-type esterase/lipase family protein, partial [Gemmataceae bacterium]|nr:GDSL-type esterase/lipase family protein [Gemmataceae bacterium]
MLPLVGAKAEGVAQQKPLPTLWLIGDSTVRNGQDTGNNGQWGWGNPIAHYFDKTKINVQNKALGGTSSRTFDTPKLWGNVLTAMKPGDFVIMQFGHNDGGKPDDPSRARATLPGNGDNTVEIDNPLTKKKEVVHSFGWYLRKYVTEAQAKGASEVIICSLIPRNRWTGGKIIRDKSHGVWAAEAAKQAKT